MTIYLDNASTTFMSEGALRSYCEISESVGGNPQGNHSISRRAIYLLDEFRERTAILLSCNPSEVYFTSGATESNNIAVLGSAMVSKVPACAATEHKAVLGPTLARNGLVIPVTTQGEIDQDFFRDFLRSNAGRLDLVSIMTVNNETGVICSTEILAGMVTKHVPGALFHSDAVQAAHIMDLKNIVQASTSIALSAHKFHGPKGTGILYLDKRAKLKPIYLGGSQENELRPGTQDVASIGAMVFALEETVLNIKSNIDALKIIQTLFENLLLQKLPNAIIQCNRVNRSPAISNVLLPQTLNEEMLFLLDSKGVCASGGAACSSGALGASHVVSALGVDNKLAKSALRFSFSSTMTTFEIEQTVEAIVQSYDTLVGQGSRK